MDKDNRLATWFWAIIRELEPIEQGKVLLFCTGSSRVPGGGMAELQGYNGEPHRFTVSKTYEEFPSLPTAATCFNTLKVPNYTSQAQFQERLMYALNNSAGFAEADA